MWALYVPIGDAWPAMLVSKPKLSVTFEQNLARADWHLYEIFENCSLRGRRSPPRVQNRRGPGDGIINLCGFKLMLFKLDYDLFYKVDLVRREKRVPKNIGEFLTPRALAYWFMDDGTYH